MNISTVSHIGNVEFPAFMGDKIYMRKFYKKDGLPKDISRWQAVVDGMLESVKTEGPIFIMVDEARVLAGRTHRRKGIHIDGYWNEALKAHGGGSGHSMGMHGTPGSGGGHKFFDFDEEEALLLASNVAASAAYVGEWRGEIRDGGDCSEVDVSALTRIELEKNKVYAGNVTMLHESLPVPFDCNRSLVRLNVPGLTNH